MSANNNNVIMTLVRDIGYMKHQLLCVMQALKVRPCACTDCIYYPAVISGDNEEIVPEQSNGISNRTNPISNLQQNIYTPAISCDSAISLYEEGSENSEKNDTVKVENVSFTEENMKETADSFEIDGSQPRSGEQQVFQCQITRVISLKNTNQITNGSSSMLPKSKANGHTTTKRRCPSMPKSVVHAEKSDTDPAPHEIQREGSDGRRRNFCRQSFKSAIAKLNTKKRVIRRFSKKDKKAIYECYVKKGLQETAKEFGVPAASITWQIHSSRLKATKDRNNVNLYQLRRANNPENVPNSNNNSNFNGDSTSSTIVCGETTEITMTKTPKNKKSLPVSVVVAEEPSATLVCLNKTAITGGRSGCKKSIRKKARRVYTQEEKKLMFETYLEKGLKDTAEQFRLSMMALYMHIRSYKSQAAPKAGGDNNVQKRLKTSGDILPNRLRSGDKVDKETLNQKDPHTHATDDNNVELKQLNGGDRMEEEQNEFLAHKESSQTACGEDTVQLKPVKIEKKPCGHSRGSRKKLMPEFKKALYKFYLKHGRVQTVKRFKISNASLDYVAYGSKHKQMRMDVKKEANDPSQTVVPLVHATTSCQDDDESDWTEASSINSSSVVDVFAVIAPNDNNENDATESPNLKNASSIVEKPKNGVSFLTKEQQKQVFEVMRMLEESGKEITPDIFVEAAKQILQRSPNFDPKNMLKLNSHWSFYWMKKYQKEEKRMNKKIVNR